jgi:hypothetical protein
VEERFAARGFGKATVVDVPADYTHSLLNFKTSDLMSAEVPEACRRPNGDLSIKRNLGLILARMLGWNHIFFIDDDIELESADLHATVAMLARYRSAGMRVTDFPDNSVVCHAHRAAGGSQDIFVSGSALAVDSTEAAGFFPEIYNEDWLFFYDDVRTHRLGCSDRSAKQLRYDPFRDPKRAEREEFGDVIAEGLYGLLHHGVSAAEAEADYWRYFLNARWRLLDSIARRTGSVTAEIRGTMLIAVQTALLCLMQIRAEVCDRYVKTWQQDLQAWRSGLETVRQVSSIPAALRVLGLTSLATGQHVPWQDPTCEQPAGDSAPAAVPGAQAAALELLAGGSPGSITLEPAQMGADDNAGPPAPLPVTAAESE